MQQINISEDTGQFVNALDALIERMRVRKGEGGNGRVGIAVRSSVGCLH